MTPADVVPAFRRRCGVALLAIAVAAAGAGAQTLDTIQAGRILGPLAARADSTDHYVMYISRRYEAGSRAPLLLLLDPIGRAELALQRAEAAVERLGWVAMASYDARGDNTPAANQHIVNVMLSDAFSAFNVDTARVYVAGLAGTADDAWIFAYGSSGHIPGIVSAGAAGPPDSAWQMAHRGRPPFDVALMAGDWSFGYDDVMRAAGALHADSLPRRLDVFTGGADWPPEPELAQALGWLEARARARHLRPFDHALVDSLFAVDSAAAAALERSLHPAEAAEHWENAAIAWAGIHDVAYARTRAVALAADPPVRLWRAERDSLVAATADWRSSQIATLIELRQRPGVPDLRRLNDSLRIAPLEEWTHDSRDSLRADWAQRRLAEVFGHLSFYEAEAYINVRDAARALAVLDIASEIQPGSPQVCREEARAYALRGDGDRTFTALRCALAGGAISMREIRADPRYKFMEARDDYMKFIGKTGG
jgi:hypothetical protein